MNIIEYKKKRNIVVIFISLEFIFYSLLFKYLETSISYIFLLISILDSLLFFLFLI